MFSTPGSAKCPIPYASRSTPCAASPLSKICCAEPPGLPASTNFQWLFEPPLGKPGEWTVRHRPYRLQGNGRWVTIVSDCHHPPLRPFRGRPPPGRDRVLSVRTYSITRRFRKNRPAFLLRVPFFREFSSQSRSSPQAPSSSPCRDCWVLQPVERCQSGLSDPKPH